MTDMYPHIETRNVAPANPLRRVDVVGEKCDPCISARAAGNCRIAPYGKVQHSTQYDSLLHLTELAVPRLG